MSVAQTVRDRIRAICEIAFNTLVSATDNGKKKNSYEPVYYSIFKRPTVLNTTNTEKYIKKLYKD